MKEKHNETANKLYILFYDTLINYCLRQGFSEHDAKDLVSETFLRLIENSAKLRSEELAAQRAWLYSTLKNIMAEHYRKNKFTADKSFDEYQNTIPSKEDNSRIIEDISYKEMMNSVYEELSEDDKDFLNDYIEQKKTYSEISKETDKNYNTVKSQIYRRMTPIRKIILKKLQQQGIEISTFAPKKKKRTNNLK